MNGYAIAAVGILIVFMVLIFISLAVSTMRRLDEWQERKASEKKEKISSPKRAEGERPPDQNIDDTTLVLISAAVTAVFQGRAHITKIQRLPTLGTGQSWSQQGRASLQGSHVIYRKNGHH